MPTFQFQASIERYFGNIQLGYSGEATTAVFEDLTDKFISLTKNMRYAGCRIISQLNFFFRKEFLCSRIVSQLYYTLIGIISILAVNKAVSKSFFSSWVSIFFPDSPSCVTRTGILLLLSPHCLVQYTMPVVGGVKNTAIECVQDLNPVFEFFMTFMW